MTFDEHRLMDLVESTGWLFPAGEWTDIQSHLPILYTLARFSSTTQAYGKPIMEHPPRCLEIGVRQGPSTMAILQAMRRTGGHLTSLDIDPVETAVAAELIKAAGLAEFWTFHLTHSDAFVATLSGELDFLWIDGDHRDPQPTIDFGNYAPFVRENGLIAMHDYWIEPWREDEFGVQRCVEAVKPTGQYEVVNLPYSYGLTIMRKLWK